MISTTATAHATLASSPLSFVRLYRYTVSVLPDSISPDAVRAFIGEPAVNTSAIVSPTTRPRPKITPEIMPGIAEGRIMTKMVRSLPAPRAYEPSRKESGTARSASSVVRMMSGMIMSVIVRMPLSSEYPQPNSPTKKIIPKIPNTTDGMPESVSAATRTILTNTFVDFAYSTIKIAANTPITPAISSERKAMVSVLMSAGIMELFSSVQRQANKSAVRLKLAAPVTGSMLTSPR